MHAASRLIGALCALSTWAMVTTAHAGYLFDTGHGNAPGVWSLFNFTTSDAQSLGATIHLSSPGQIQSVEAYMEGGIGDVTVSVVDGNSPNGTVLFTTTMHVASDLADWRGVFGLAWALAAGDYTLTFSVPAGPDNYDGGIMGQAPNALPGTEWFTYNSVDNWFTETLEDFRLSLRVGGELYPVSEPPLVAMLLAGLALTVRLRRRP